MTLCISWIRKVDEIEELVFVTDSTLTGGEKWNSGVKLFELPRKDCLLCFAGHTNRAYPLILNLISELRSRQELQNQHIDISEVVGFITDLFTSLIQNLIPEVGRDTLDSLAAEASFIFGGWSWAENRFRIWTINYVTDAKGYLPVEQTVQKENHRVTVFLGNPSELGVSAEKKYQQFMIDNGKFDKFINMEPAVILSEMSRDPEVREIDGAPQIGKVFRSGTTQFFGVRWPSVKGSPTYLGRVFTDRNKLNVRYYDPDTFELLEEDLPLKMDDLDSFSTSEDFVFIKRCYKQLAEEIREGQQDFAYYLQDDLTEMERYKILRILNDLSYKSFLAQYNQERQEQSS